MKKIKLTLNATWLFLKTAPLYGILHIFITAFSASKVYVFALFNKFLVNEIVNQIQRNDFQQGMLSIGKIIFALFITEFAYSAIISVARYGMTKCSMRYSDKLNLSFLKKIATIDISFFDSPKQNDEMMQANKDIVSVEAIFKNLVSIITSIISTIVSIAIVISFDLLLILAIIISLIPSFLYRKKIQVDTYKQEQELNLTNFGYKKSTQIFSFCVLLAIKFWFYRGSSLCRVGESLFCIIYLVRRDSAPEKRKKP